MNRRPAASRHALLVVIGMSYSICVAPIAVACDCAKVGSTRPSLKSSDAVFEGRVNNIYLRTRWARASHPNPDDCGMQTIFEDYAAALCQDRDLVVTFDVLRSWKGVANSSISVRTPVFADECGIGFEVGQLYLVFADKTAAGLLRSDKCKQTRSLPDAADDMKHLGRPKGNFLAEHSKDFGAGNAANQPLGQVRQ